VPSFKRVLIANRGEIACRVIRSAHALGYETVAAYSDADTGALHTRLADQAIHIGGSPASESYLSIEKIIAAAKKSGADAIHPGYGFLSENAEFSKACDDNGIVFIGPPPEAIRLMGSKRIAKIKMQEANVPVVPGYSGGAQDAETLQREAERLGVPLMIKASKGGGGRGLRLVTDPNDLMRAVAAARAEAQSSFGDGELILERAILSPRHVEIQVFADRHGNAIYLGERDCSVQRRHQKVVEEAPSPAVTPEIRAKMGAAAVAAAKAIGYVGAGTVEMLLDASGEFYFMEMNTRLQVEHPVTEMITGFDLVAWQLDVAAGKKLPVSQEEVTLNGHAIEVRLYAEDAYNGFLPQIGTAEYLGWPAGVGVRVDHGLRPGQAVTAFYDAMVAKIITHGRDRAEAIRRMLRALRETTVHGLVTNRSFLHKIVEHPVFQSGEATTDFIAKHMQAPKPAPSDALWGVAAFLFARQLGDNFWRSGGINQVPLRLREGSDERRVMVSPTATSIVVKSSKGELRLSSIQVEEGQISFAVDSLVQKARFALGRQTLSLSFEAEEFYFEKLPHSDAANKNVGAGSVVAPMAGRVVDVRVEVGQSTKREEIVLILEAMKMQLELTAPRDGKISAVNVRVGDQVENKQTLIEITD
jgi:geranyl-CoA carboxylase alpha subunit